MRAIRVAILLVAVSGVREGASQQTIPTLAYDPPPNFYHSASHPPENFTSNDVNASLQVYPFRRFTGDIAQMLQQTLLREWIDPQFQEARLGAPPRFGRDSIPGAQFVYNVVFVEDPSSGSRQHFRVVIVVGNMAAIVDASANSPYSWERALPGFNAMWHTLRVGSEAPPPSLAGLPAATGRAVAGIYVGTKPKYMVDLNRPAGSGYWVTALHYYLFSTDGRVYRGYDLPIAPSSDIRHFDFDQAQRDDPGNSGRYTLQGNQLYMEIGGGLQPEVIRAPLPQGNRVVIETVVYLRQ